MILLLAFAVLAGAITAVTPCVLPVLPALLSASGTGGRRRPLGIVAGLTLTHTITIVGIASVVDGVGFADGTLRMLAIAVLALFGIALLVPRASERIEQRLSFLSRLAPRSAGEGFWSGLPVGGALGFVYAPCAGPILTAIISVSASQGTTGELVAVGVAYGLGSAATLLGLAIGGRRVIGRLRRGRRGPLLQRAFGVVMVLTAMLMFSKLDLRFRRRSPPTCPASCATRRASWSAPQPSRILWRACAGARCSTRGRRRRRERGRSATLERTFAAPSWRSWAPRRSSPTPSAGSTPPR